MTDPEELNCGLVLDFHFGDNADQDLRRKADFLKHLVDEPAFSTLRTKEQLGYAVQSKGYETVWLDVTPHRYVVTTSRWTSVGTTVLRFRIQSRKDPVFLEERIEAFLNLFLEQLKAMTDDDFHTRRRGLIVKKLEKPKNLAEEAGDYWGQIISGYYHFSQGEFHGCRLQREQHNNPIPEETDAVALETVTKAEMTGIYEKYLLQKGSCRRTLAVHMISRRLETVLPLPKETMEIIDVCSFKAGLDSTPGAEPITSHIPESRM